MDPDHAFQFANSSLEKCQADLRRGGSSYFFSDLEAALNWAMDGWVTTHVVQVKAQMYSSTNQDIQRAFREHANPALASEVDYLLNRLVNLEYHGAEDVIAVMSELAERAERVIERITRACQEDSEE